MPPYIDEMHVIKVVFQVFIFGPFSVVQELSSDHMIGMKSNYICVCVKLQVPVYLKTPQHQLGLITACCTTTCTCRAYCSFYMSASASVTSAALSLVHSADNGALSHSLISTWRSRISRFNHQSILWV